MRGSGQGHGDVKPRRWRKHSPFGEGRKSPRGRVRARAAGGRWYDRARVPRLVATERQVMGRHRSIVVVIAVAACVAAGRAYAIDVATIAAAKKEGEVVWYSTQIINQLVRPVAAAFEKKYGIKVRYTRANAT